MFAATYRAETLFDPAIASGTSMMNADVLARVMEYENPDLLARIGDKLGLAPEEAVALFGDLKRFLFLCGVVNGRWSPTEAIDEAWHHFILFTKDYSAFCHYAFGRFIHHEPRRVGLTSHGLGINRTRLAAESIFGPLSGNWHSRAEMSAECSKSGCNCSPDTGGGGDECCPD